MAYVTELQDYFISEKQMYNWLGTDVDIRNIPECVHVIVLFIGQVGWLVGCVEA